MAGNFKCSCSLVLDKLISSKYCGEVYNIALVLDCYRVTMEFMVSASLYQG